MKHALLLLLAFTVATFAEDITTTDDHAYKNVTVTRAEPDGLVVETEAGIEKIPFTLLPPELQKKYGFNPNASAAFQAQVRSAAAKRQSEIFQTLAQQKATAEAQWNASESAKKERSEKEAQNQMAQSWNPLDKPAQATGGINAGEAVAIHGEVIQRTKDGLLVDCSDSGKLGSKKAKGIIWLTGMDAREGAQVSGRAIANGTYSYTTTEGAERIADQYAWLNGSAK